MSDKIIFNNDNLNFVDIAFKKIGVKIDGPGAMLDNTFVDNDTIQVGPFTITSFIEDVNGVCGVIRQQQAFSVNATYETFSYQDGPDYIEVDLGIGNTLGDAVKLCAIEALSWGMDAAIESALYEAYPDN